PGLQEVFDRRGVAARVQGLGARFGIYFGVRDEVRSYRDAVKHHREQMLRFVASAIGAGVYFHDYGGAAWHHGFCAAMSLADTNELGGFIQSLRAWPERPEIVGLVRLPAWPGGAATHDTFEWLAGELTESLRAALPVDAVLLALHGALAAEGAPDVEGEILD